MSYRTTCTIYKPIPIFDTEWVRDPVIFEILHFDIKFKDSFKEWMANNLKGWCTIAEFSQEQTILEFELREDQILFELTWK